MFLLLQGNNFYVLVVWKLIFLDEVGRFQRLVFPKGVVGPENLGTFQNLPAVKSLSLQNLWLTPVYGQPPNGNQKMSNKNPGHRKDQWLFLATEVHLQKIGWLTWWSYPCRKNQISEFTRIKPFFFKQNNGPDFSPGSFGCSSPPCVFNSWCSFRKWITLVSESCCEDFGLKQIDDSQNVVFLTDTIFLEMIHVFNLSMFFSEKMSPLIWLRIKILRFYGLTCFTWKYGK